MKNLVIYILGSISFVLLAVSCERLNNQVPEIRFNSVFIEQTLFSECIQENSAQGYGTLGIRSEPNGYLMFHAENTEFCCDTDSILIGLGQSGETVDIEIYDMGPYSYCFCDHDLFFAVGPFKEQKYNFRLVESVDAYRRDTFEFSLDLANFIDTIIYPVDTTSIIPQDTINPPPPPPLDSTLLPPLYLSTIFGGCNNDSTYKGVNEPDTAYFYLEGDTAIIFAGFKYTCCAPFTSSYSLVDNTIILVLKDNCTQPFGSCYCKCKCYYTFEFKIKLEAPFRVYPFKIYVDNPNQGGEYLFWEDYISGPLELL